MVNFAVNGKTVKSEQSADTPLLWVIRDELGLTGTKFGCGIAQCGACTVHLNGAPVRSCITPVSAVGAGEITTVEGLAATPQGAAIRAAWEEVDVAQCGYCQAGQLMSAAALLTENPQPTDDDIDNAMAGNLCRCATYLRIRAGIHRAAELTAASTKQEAAK